jgi:hypothetical protein
MEAASPLNQREPRPMFTVSSIEHGRGDSPSGPELLQDLEADRR